MDNLINKIIKTGTPCYFISPHLDDAVFSAGDLIAYLSNHVPVHIINVFTKVTSNPNTLSALVFLRQCKQKNAKKLFYKRVKEDALVWSKLGIIPKNLGYIDALWRSKGNYLSFLLPELGATYPTYRFHVISGKPAVADSKLIADLSGKLSRIIPDKAVIFTSLGIGKHVDHIIVRNICKNLFNKVIYWADFPYDQKHSADEEFITYQHLTKRSFENDLSLKANLMSGYQSQISAIFPDGLFKLPLETYYLGKDLI